MKCPGTIDLALSMAATHGMLNRTTSAERITELTLEALGAEGVYTEDVDALEAWLNTLSAKQKDILIDGEEEEMAVLIAESPTSILSGICVGQLIEDIYSTLEEKA